MAAGIPEAEAFSEARQLLCHALGITREQLISRGEDVPLTGEETARVEAVVARREHREPLAYITGTRGFYGREFVVTPAVLIPRPETELLVEAVPEGAGRIADIGTGSGCIAVSVAKRFPQAQVFATDLSAEALAVAQENARRHQVFLTFLLGDLLAPLASYAPFDVILSNPPYIAPKEIAHLQPEVRDWEPPLALGTHPDPRAIYRRLASDALPLLAPGGMLAMEVGQGQAQAVGEIAQATGFSRVTLIPDYAGIERVVITYRS